MPNHGESLLSKILDEGNVLPIRKHDIQRSDFSTEVERDVYSFIMQYASENRNQTPDYRTVVEKFPDFYYREGVVDEYRYLTRELKSWKAKNRIASVVMGGQGQTLEDRLNSEKDGNDLIDELIEELRDISHYTSVKEKVGKSLKHDSKDFIEEYYRRKAGESVKIWLSKFGTVNREIGGYYSGNTYAWFGRSGRGKSVFVMEEAIEAAYQGANVLIWAMEMSWYEWLARAYASVSAREGVMKGTVDGVGYDIGFENRGMLSGNLPPELENALETFIDEVNERIPGNISVRSVDDEDFQRRDLAQLEKDIIQSEADVVVVDPFYYLDYEANTSRKTGGDAENTSKKMRALAGRTKTVIHVVTQADEIEESEGADGERELDPPQRKHVMKTQQILQDAANLFGIDTSDGRGIIRLGKGRNGGEGSLVEVIYLPNYGVVQELDEEELMKSLM